MNEKLTFTHFDAAGRPQMVDVSSKDSTPRQAVAECYVHMLPSTKESIVARAIDKGDVLSIAEVAGIMGAKKTSELIPLCHPLPLTKVFVETNWVETKRPGRAALCITATVKTTYQTGVEMEALAACTVAALTVYDMCKAIDKQIIIDGVRLISKQGGRSGNFQADPIP